MELVASWPARMRLADVGAYARRVERLGFDTLHVPETIHDPFVVSTLALGATASLRVRTSMVVAFPRSPMVTALAAWDLADLSGGRFDLGIASQVRGNIVGRYSTQWSEPAPRLKDYVLALRAIFAAFQSESGLSYDGSHYRFDRLQPYFNPGPLEVDAPRIWTGGVNRQMTVVAGEVADGFVCHPTHSHPRILAEITRPALADGVAAAGRADAGPAVIVGPQPVMGPDQAALDVARETRRQDLAFLYSTPAYARQLEVLGFPGLGDTLADLAQRGAWDDLSNHLTDEVLETLVPHGTYDDLPAILEEWYARTCAGIGLAVPDDPSHDEQLGAFVRACRNIETYSVGGTGWAILGSNQ